ncbi:MAG: hypothetical protein WCT36_06090 [Candidatus Gracilibacteria bacterium]
MEINPNYLERFTSKERKPATNKIYLIQLLADQCGLTWRDIFKLNHELIVRELQEALDEGKNAGRKKRVEGVWTDKTPEEIQESIKIRTLWCLKNFREKLRIEKLKVN